MCDNSQKLIDDAQSASDPQFRAKFVDLPHYLDVWTRQVGGLSGKRILDFGCGHGETAAAIALTRAPGRVVGVDINDEHKNLLEELRVHLALDALPDTLTFERIEPGAMPSETGFDLIYSWSVFEHIDQMLFDEVVQKLRNTLADPGFLFVQIAPLFYSAEGSHFARYGMAEWEHLTLQVDEMRRRLYSAPGISAETKRMDWSCFETLNKLTAEGMIEAVTRNGFELVQKQFMVEQEIEAPAKLLRIFHRDVLMTNQVVAFFKKS